MTTVTGFNSGVRGFMSLVIYAERRYNVSRFVEESYFDFTLFDSSIFKVCFLETCISAEINHCVELLGDDSSLLIFGVEHPVFISMVSLNAAVIVLLCIIVGLLICIKKHFCSGNKKMSWNLRSDRVFSLQSDL